MTCPGSPIARRPAFEFRPVLPSEVCKRNMKRALVVVLVVVLGLVVSFVQRGGIAQVGHRSGPDPGARVAHSTCFMSGLAWESTTTYVAVDAPSPILSLVV